MCPKGDDEGLQSNFFYPSGCTSVLAAGEDGGCHLPEAAADTGLSVTFHPTYPVLPAWNGNPLANSCLQVLHLLESLNMLSFPVCFCTSLLHLSVPISNLGSRCAYPVPRHSPRPAMVSGTQGTNSISTQPNAGNGSVLDGETQMPKYLTQ